MTLHLKAETEDAGTRLDAFVASRANGLTRSQAARYIEEGRVSVDGKPAAKSCRITGGEAVTVDVPEVRDTALTAQDIPLDVVYEDADVIVVNKPAGMVVHPAPGHPDGTLVNALLYHCAGTLSGVGGALRPGLVHGLRGNAVGAHGHQPDVRALGTEGRHQLATQSPALPVNDKHVHAVPQKSISSSRSRARM